jgi:hypothetical protein
MAKKIDPEVAEARMRARGWNPSGVYPGALRPWHGTCAACGRVGAPKYANVVTSGQGPCRWCSGSQKRSDEDARAIIAQRGLEPLGPYPGNNTPWLVRCSVCGGTTSPTLTSVRKALKLGRGYGCDLCRRNGPIRPADAEDILRAAGAEPLVRFPGVKKHWPSRCLHEHCQREIAPTLDSIKHARTGACVYCGGYGIKADDEALVYLVVHPLLSAAKIGIAKTGSKRLWQHESAGWQHAQTVTMLGHQARAVESAVLGTWRGLALPYGVEPAAMPFAGYTETVSLHARPLRRIEEDLARAVAAELNMGEGR